MFDKDTAKELRKAFWTHFGIHMSQHVSARGYGQKWLNYRTGISHIFFRWEAERGTARVAIDLQFNDPGIRELVFQQFEEFQTLLHSNTGVEWTWLPEYRQATGKIASRIVVEQKGWDFYNREDWPSICNWFEPIIVGLDDVWGDAYDIFKDFAN